MSNPNQTRHRQSADTPPVTAIPFHGDVRSSTTPSSNSPAERSWFTAGTVQWARINRSARVPMRRGAWYRVLRAGTDEVAVVVRYRPILVPRAVVEVRETPPMSWTQVAVDGGDSYFVCPHCATRVHAPRDGSSQPSLECPRCDGAFAVEVSPGATSVPPAPRMVGHELRRSERRQNHVETRIDRRWGHERRTSHRAALFDDFTTP
jgi:hypothetical protein